jgi:nitrogen fixation NifU-like protein
MDDMFRDELMDIYKNPMNQGLLDDHTHEADGVNSMCGDKVSLQLKIVDGKIVDAKFHGDACSVSIISSALLTEHIIGKTVEEAKKITKEELLEMIGLNLTTSRVKCATLVLSALEGALEGFDL